MEFLLGRYCATTNDKEIVEGLEIVERQLEDRTVRTGEEELFKSRAANWHGDCDPTQVFRVCSFLECLLGTFAPRLRVRLAR
jgi:hypothetical protein